MCFAGGVALNCVAADKIRRLPGVGGYFAPPAASDRGQALGCALYAWHRLTGDLPQASPEQRLLRPRLQQ
ncbi:hypothetical protein [Streptomyces sp. NBC_00723]|uniref:hypothetical protein n=1 Tax=Streptomyces sp. NBC_00723 TaxID=2903673 RepID=UPI003870ABD3